MFWMIMHKMSLQAQRQAETDSLTSVPNRRAMDGYFAQLYSQQQGAIAVMMIDIDKFKDINDSFGHRAGDCYLVSISKEIQKNLQPEAALFRYAGDEFLVVTQQADRRALTVTAQTVQQKVENLLVPWSDGKIIQTTVSVGLAMSEQRAGSWDELVQLADLAMYRVKSNGGNGVAWYEEEIQVKQSI
jgi:diguanylate cyclase (GGDEF)-like protein